MSAKRTDSTGAKVLRWIARILSIPPIVFYFLFLIGHLVGEGKSSFPITPGEMVGLGALIVLTSLMVIGLIVAWKWEGIGSFMVLISSIILFIILIIAIGRSDCKVALIINVPFFIPGILFFGTWWSSRRGAQV